MLDVYAASQGKEVKGRIAQALADRRREEAIGPIVDGLRGEGNPWVRVLIDASLSRLEFRDRYYSNDRWAETQEPGSKQVYDYWCEPVSHW